jgi:hypothetical protein
MFGRPPRDTGLESERNNNTSDAQHLYMINSSDIQHKIEQSPQLREIMKTVKWNRTDIIRQYYLFILSRYPTQTEDKIAEQYFQTGGLTVKQAADDLAWTLINSKEFLYRH